MLTAFFGHDIPIVISLLVIISILLFSVLASLIIPPKPPKED
jgi:hypothetical protein